MPYTITGRFSGGEVMNARYKTEEAALERARRWFESGSIKIIDDASGEALTISDLEDRIDARGQSDA